MARNTKQYDPHWVQTAPAFSLMGHCHSKEYGSSKY